MSGYGKGESARQYTVQQTYRTLMEQAAAGALLDRPGWLLQPSGDGELSVILDEECEPRVVDPFVRHLNALLAQHNQGLDEQRRLRMRVAIHHGMYSPAANGLAGKAVVELARMLDSQPLRAALGADPVANLALMVSQRVFEDIVEYGLTSYAVDDFTQVDVRQKEFAQRTWLHVPRTSASDPASASSPVPDRQRGESRQQVVTNHFSGPVRLDGGTIGISNH
jgi:hypothetical protein